MLDSELNDREFNDNTGGGRGTEELSPPAPSVPAAVFQPPQVLFQPPNVSGWNYAQWLDTSRWAGRLVAANQALSAFVLNHDRYPYGDDESNEQALRRALRFWGDPSLSDQTRARLLGLGRRIMRGQTATWQVAPAHNTRQNAYRVLIPMTNDYQTC